jgi:hypothetical protein
MILITSNLDYKVKKLFNCPDEEKKILNGPVA